MLNDPMKGCAGMGKVDMGTSRIHPMEALYERLASLFGRRGVTSYLAYELAVYYYALLSWGKRSFERDYAKSYTAHKESGWLTMVLFVIKLLILEGILVHFFVAKWSSVFAWIMSISNVYMIIWLISDYRAMKLNPIGVSAQGVWIRLGNQLRTSLSFEQIESVEVVNNVELSGVEEKNSFIPIGLSTNVHIRLKEATRVGIMLGANRTVTDIYLTLDEPRAFVEECRTRLESVQLSESGVVL
ncbi:hypothetical protein [Paenibacillus arenosi]|uniref:DUF304 domain-containing protein n=1 Tax=Paenibacillus arenosi TaxID=2774142 RepID=A0ABR9AVD3_9BACL|nr:hypothetical protein [Paenibacillus arenosi]MBD8498085.1 hypothetical protein [Paenibacillus arenosi]